MKVFAVLFLFTSTLMGCVNIAISPEVIGTVVDVDGKPIQAKVIVIHGQLSERIKIAMTDNSGEYSISEFRQWTAIPFSAIRLNSIVKIEALGYKAFTYETDNVDDIPQRIVLYRR